MRTIAFLIAMTIGVGAALSSRFGGLLFYLWFGLFRPQEWVWIDVEAFRLSLIAGALFVVPTLFSGVWPNLTHPLGLGSLVFLALGLVAHFNAVDPATSWFWLDFTFRQILVMLLMITLVNTPRRFTLAITVMSMSLAFHASKFGVGYLIRGGARFDAGIGGSFGASNEFSLAVDRILPLLVAAAQNIQIPWMSMGMLIAVPFSILGVLSTFSRGGILALAVASTMFLLLQKQRKWVMAVLALGAIAYQFMPVPESFVDRMNTITTYEEVQDQSALGRLHFWEVATRMADAQPLGVGLRNYEANYDRYDFSGGLFGLRRSAHSSYFQVLAETGYLGVAVFVGLLAYAFWLTVRIRWKARRWAGDTGRFFVTSSNALIASQVAFMIGGAFNAEALNEVNWFVFGLVASLDRLAKEANVVAKQPAEDVRRQEPQALRWRPVAAARTGASLAPGKAGSAASRFSANR
jgi:probable O-glycosylation ligase (exosortase A-associated)